MSDTPADTIELERRAALDFLMQLRSDWVRTFVREHALPLSGTRAVLRERVAEALASDEISLADLVAYLDEVEQWNKQHVFLYDLTRQADAELADRPRILEQLQREGFADLVDEPLPLIVPRELTLSSIAWPDDELAVTAVLALSTQERRTDLDEERSTPSGVVSFRAYLEVTRRIIVRLRAGHGWATLGVSQLQRGGGYEEIRDQFLALIDRWFPAAGLQPLRLNRCIEHLHDLEPTPQQEARSHVIGLMSHGGRELTVSSAAPDQSALGEPAFDNALTHARGGSVGRSGNFFWLPTDGGPLTGEVHTILIAREGRVNFTTPNDGESLRHVLARIRDLSR